MTSTPPSVCTQEAVADLVFMVDGSWSIGTENFDQIRQFLYTLVDSFDVSPDHVRVGLVQYSSSPRTEFKLNTFQSKKGILEYIKRLPYRGGGTNTGQGLDFMLNNHFVNPSGSRVEQKVPQIAVVITDGKSQDEVAHHAERLRSRGIILYAIGIKDADENELKQIANRPHSQYVHSVSDFSALQGISQNIVQTLCTTVEEAKKQLQQLSQGKELQVTDRSTKGLTEEVFGWSIFIKMKRCQPDHVVPEGLMANTCKMVPLSVHLRRCDDLRSVIQLYTCGILNQSNVPSLIQILLISIHVPSQYPPLSH